jgi:hypothetical protein
MSADQQALDLFVERLLQLDLDPQQLRDDPTGEQWLPHSLRRMAREDPACRQELAEFVQIELALHDMPAPLDVHQPSDVFFTRRVMERLPKREAVDDQRRNWILASAYALAIGVAYLLLGPLLSSGELTGWFEGSFEPVHSWYHGYAIEAGGMWMVALLAGCALALALVPAGRRRADA